MAFLRAFRGPPGWLATAALALPVGAGVLALRAARETSV